MQERRRQSSPRSLEGVLWHLPAHELLDRLPTAILGVESRGDIAYVNAACAEMLGYPDRESVMRMHLPELLTGHGAHPVADCVDTLRTAASIVDWNHEQGYVVRTLLSPSLLLRSTDVMLLIGITDVTAWMWETKAG